MAGVFQPNVFQFNVFQQASLGEIACVHYQNRTYKVAFEYRVARALFDPDRHPDAEVAEVLLEDRKVIVLFENRVYHIAGEQRTAVSGPRKRIC